MVIKMMNVGRWLIRSRKPAKGQIICNRNGLFTKLKFTWFATFLDDSKPLSFLTSLF